MEIWSKIVVHPPPSNASYWVQCCLWMVKAWRSWISSDRSMAGRQSLLHALLWVPVGIVIGKKIGHLRTVEGGSMEPTISRGDKVFVCVLPIKLHKGKPRLPSTLSLLNHLTLHHQMMQSATNLLHIIFWWSYPHSLSLSLAGDVIMLRFTSPTASFRFFVLNMQHRCVRQQC